MKKIVVIGSNDPHEGYINGEIEQEIVFRFDFPSKTYRIKINSQSVQSQSHARLEAWTETGFSNIITKDPKTHYGIEAAYKHEGNIPKAVFAPIVEDLVEVAWNFNEAAKYRPAA